jgi:hypothetical protein
MQVVLLKCAEADLREAYASLEERREGLGDLFFRALDSAMERLRHHPRMEPTYQGRYRRLVLRPFGFGVFYVFTIGPVWRVMVCAILDLRQDREVIFRRLG